MLYTKRILFIFLFFIFCQTTDVFANDISGHWAETSIQKWHKEGKIAGYEDGSFQPDKAITRAEFIQLLHNLFPYPYTSPPTFQDVQKKDWFYKAVASAVNQNIIHGFEDNTFRPYENITRSETSIILTSLLQLSEDTKITNILPDVNDVPNWAKGAVGAVIKHQYLIGYENGYFFPQNYLTRAEAISILDRIPHLPTTNTVSFEKTNTQDNTVSENTKGTMVWERGNHTTVHDTDKTTTTHKIITKYNIDSYEGQTIKEDVQIQIDTDNLELKDITFLGNVEIFTSTESTNHTKIPTLYFSGTTNINQTLTISTPITMQTEENTIHTLLLKAKTNLNGNALIKILKTDFPLFVNQNITIQTLETSGSTKLGTDTTIQQFYISPNENTEITVEGSVDTISTKGSGTIKNLILKNNVTSKLTVSPHTTIKTLQLLENAKADITVKKQAKIEQIFSLSKSFGTILLNEGIVESIFAQKPESISTEHDTVLLAQLQNIKILTPPEKLHYQQGEKLSLSGISLLLEYPNDITQKIENTQDFYHYAITASPKEGEVLTIKHHKQPIILQSNNITAFTAPLNIDYEIEQPSADTSLLNKLITDCNNLLQTVKISQTGIEFPIGTKWVTEENYTLFNNIIIVSEEMVSKNTIHQSEIDAQYIALKKAFETFLSQIQTVEIKIETPTLLISNTTPEYGEEGVRITIENLQNGVSYYYTLNGENPNQNDIENTKLYQDFILLSPPKEITQTNILVKVIGIKDNISSKIAQETITYSAALPIENITLSGLETPITSKEPTDTLYCEENTYIIGQKPIWKDSNNLEVTDVFLPETNYTAYFSLTSKKPHIFTENIVVNVLSDSVKEIHIIPENSDNENLFVAVSFESTPPLPTEEAANQILEDIFSQVVFYPIFVSEDIFETKEEQTIQETILQSISEIIPNYWAVTIELDTIKTLSPSELLVCGKFTVQSTLDDTIIVSNENFIDMTLKKEL